MLLGTRSIHIPGTEVRVSVSIPAGQVYRGVMNPSCGSLVWNPYKTLRPFLRLQVVLGEKPGGSGATKGDRARAAGALRQSFESTLEASCMRVRDPQRPEKGLALSPISGQGFTNPS